MVLQLWLVEISRMFENWILLDYKNLCNILLSLKYTDENVSEKILNFLSIENQVKAPMQINWK